MVGEAGRHSSIRDRLGGVAEIADRDTIPQTRVKLAGQMDGRCGESRAGQIPLTLDAARVGQTPLDLQEDP